MMTKGAVFAATAVLFAAGISPSWAGDWDWEWRPDLHWRVTHRALSDVENRIAFLEANPEIDDGYKAPIVKRGRGDVFTLRNTLPPPHWRWASPCCYSRRPIHIR